MSFKNKIKNYFTMDDEYEYEYIEEDNLPDKVTPKQKSQNVVNLQSVQQPAQRVVLCEPRSYNEAQEIADNIVNKRSVVINLQRVENHQAKRIVDFLSGTVYALNGDIQKLGAETFLCTPESVDVTGSISESYLYEDEL
ncbi:cell division protein SepF [Oceanobacillus indicireducens]|uniref:Cell division protein SepF n=1 Tax=Oceanobacillus indicireducens TaxID=1004261 RepID=A0A917XSH7_9BACI|nr:cell division protein SepF [Oceanobacillus indicireducens]GGN49352.1 cell division protein SepF [Oceanobacillus indicireducens]